MKLHSSDKQNKRSMAFSGAVSAFLLTLCCSLCFIGATWAWFTSNASVSTAELVSAWYNTILTVKEGDNEVTPEDGKYNLDPSKVYTVTIEAEGTATTGFTDVSIDGKNYTTIQLAPGEKITITIGGWEGLTSEPSWGVSAEEADSRTEDEDEIFKDIKVSYYAFGDKEATVPDKEKTEYVLLAETDEKATQALTSVPDAPEYENYKFVGWALEDGTVIDPEKDTFYKDTVLYATYEKYVVKLVPLNEDSTAMIERDGIVETYNTFEEDDRTPYGVTSIITPNMDRYMVEDYDSWYVYGLCDRLSVEDLADYVKVTADGTYKVYKNDGTTEAEPSDNLGTGLVIKVFDGDTVVEQFYIVIFGDIDGDGYIASQDYAKVLSEVRSSSWSVTDGSNYTRYLVKAANLDLDDYIASQDYAKLLSTVRGANVIDQTTGYSSSKK